MKKVILFLFLTVMVGMSATAQQHVPAIESLVKKLTAQAVAVRTNVSITEDRNHLSTKGIVDPHDENLIRVESRSTHGLAHQSDSVVEINIYTHKPCSADDVYKLELRIYGDEIHSVELQANGYHYKYSIYSCVMSDKNDNKHSEIICKHQYSLTGEYVVHEGISTEVFVEELNKFFSFLQNM